MTEPPNLERLFPPDYLSDIINYSWIPLYLDKSFLYQKYCLEMMSTQEVAEKINVAASTIHKYLRIHNIPLRGPGESPRQKMTLGYGYRLDGRFEVIHKGEQKNIYFMKKLRDRGYSYWRIADIFNERQVPTKTRKGRWHARSIKQILDRHEQKAEEDMNVECSELV